MIRGMQDALMRRRWTRTALVKTVLAGDAVHCPCCGSSFRRFAPFNGHPNRLCWTCGALERHRQLALLFSQRPELLRPDLRVLHIAPESALRRLIERAAPARYVTADLDGPGVDMHFDLTAAPLEEGSFDVVVCNHVMEHIPDDRAALGEIRRILAPGGWALVMTPIVVETTVEDPAETDPDERLRRFGQVDHVRRYGWDYLGRLEEAGLQVEVVRSEDTLPADAVERCRLRNTQGFPEPIFLASRSRARAGQSA
jgi:SAM-dependent methyltransferase